MYLLKLIKNQSLDRDSIAVMCHELIVSRVQYVLSSWGGFISVDLTCQINALFKRLFRYGYLSQILDFHTLLDASDLSFYLLPSHKMQKKGTNK